MKIFVYVLCLCCILPVMTFGINWPMLDGNTTDAKIRQLNNWIYSPTGANIEYEFHNLPQHYWVTLMTHKADCTDVTILSRHILWREGIETRIVRGWLYDSRHDWYEYRRENGSWYSIEYNWYNSTELQIDRYKKFW